ncbi:hypothetical protein LCGC14_2600000, partial [marine sediment metagenome]
VLDIVKEEDSCVYGIIYGIQKHYIGLIDIAEGFPKYYSRITVNVKINQIIIDKALKQKTGLTIGDTLQIKNNEFEIIGISDDSSMMIAFIVFMTLEDSKIFLPDDLISFFVVQVEDGLGITEVKTNLENGIDLNLIVEMVRELIVPRKVNFVKTDLPKVNCDREKIKQLFSNLFENAIIHGNPKSLKVESKEAKTQQGLTNQYLEWRGLAQYDALNPLRQRQLDMQWDAYMAGDERFDKWWSNKEKREPAVEIKAMRTPGKIGNSILDSLVNYNFKGKVYPINPKADKIFGQKCYPTVSAVPGNVDLVVISVDLSITAPVLEDCAKKGVHSVVIVSGGGKELGGERAAYEAEVKRLSAKHKIRIIGPNCIGMFNAANRLDCAFQGQERMVRAKLGVVAFLSQSGTMGISFLESADSFGLSKMVSYGNRSDVDEADMIWYLANDPQTKVIALYVEGFGDGRKFINT